jgi:hypothetical protein
MLTLLMYSLPALRVGNGQLRQRNQPEQPVGSISKLCRVFATAPLMSCVLPMVS